MCFIFFFFNDTATTEIYTLSLHDALPILRLLRAARLLGAERRGRQVFYVVGDLHIRSMLSDMVDHVAEEDAETDSSDRKSTRLNSSHANISYAVFCLKKKNNISIYILSTI